MDLNVTDSPGSGREMLVSTSGLLEHLFMKHVVLFSMKMFSQCVDLI